MAEFDSFVFLYWMWKSENHVTCTWCGVTSKAKVHFYLAISKSILVPFILSRPPSGSAPGEKMLRHGQWPRCEGGTMQYGILPYWCGEKVRRGGIRARSCMPLTWILPHNVSNMSSMSQRTGLDISKVLCASWRRRCRMSSRLILETKNAKSGDPHPMQCNPVTKVHFLRLISKIIFACFMRDFQFRILYMAYKKGQSRDYPPFDATKER